MQTSPLSIPPVDDHSNPAVRRYFHARGEVGVVSFAIFQRMMMMIVVDEWKVGRQRLLLALFAICRRGGGGGGIGELESIIGFDR